MSEKLALVTGASRGIGKACAIELAKAGYDIAVNFAGNVEAANKTVEELKALGVEAEAFKFDVSNKEEAAKGVEDVLAKFGRIDVLVNNAGITRDGLFIYENERRKLGRCYQYEPFKRILCFPACC